MNRRLALLFFALLPALAACQQAEHGAATNAGTLRIVATVLPVENLTLAVARGAANARVEGLLPVSAGCPHDYSLTPGDMKKLEQADVLVAVGLDYEPFLDRVRENFGDKVKIVIAADDIERLGDPGEAAEPAGDRHHVPYNDHPFVSPKQAAKMARAIARELGEVDPRNAPLYQANAEKLAADLEAAQADLAAFVAMLPNKQVVAVSPIFGYLLRDIGLTPAAVLESAHLEGLASARLAAVTRQFRAAKPALILNESQFDEKVAQTLRDEIGVKMITLGTQVDGAHGPTAFLDQARAMAPR